MDAIKADDVTVSLVREAKPEGLFRYFEEHQYLLTNPYRGIYYVEGTVLFPTQIIVTKELEEESHIWLRALSDRMEKHDMTKLLESINRLTGKGDRELADSVLEVSVQANRQVIEELMGDDSMSQALLELMEPQLLQREEKGIRRGIEQGIEQMIINMYKNGFPVEQIASIASKSVKDIQAIIART